MAQHSTVAEETDNQQVAVGFLRLVAIDGRPRDAFAKYVSPGLRHHDPGAGGTAEDLLAAMEADAREFPHKRLDVKNVIADGELVAVHSHIRRWDDDPGAAVVHLFRVRAGRIVELWDVASAVPLTSRNPNGVF